eukprot:gnl/Chilomastix_caulleri/3326.p1 GENE.gnl/Chilomastix_caulleri/3326~~gnl/Chilomastix_caulleri/3326.p1  ORF type:complete len:87 (+),score=8.78 gnl/Chilomastix_caulleri/3326:75-335(+)
MAALKRIARELKEMQDDPPLTCSAGPIDGNMFKWRGTIIGPSGTPYEGGIFIVNIIFLLIILLPTRCQICNKDISSQYKTKMVISV